MAGTTTGTDALNSALAIMDELNSTEYNARAIYFINILCQKLYPYSDNYVVATAGIRPIPTKITALADILPLDDVLAISVLPYGLAAQLMLADDASQAGNFEAMFQERLTEVKGRVSAAFEDIEDIYGGIEYSEYTD